MSESEPVRLRNRGYFDVGGQGEGRHCSGMGYSAERRLASRLPTSRSDFILYDETDNVICHVRSILEVEDGLATVHTQA